jgi:prepilin-type N-terminal cleavage/methylation domain-containing protein
VNERRSGVNERQAPGFTLFEVLAAVVVLGLTVTILARSAIQGMDYEGDASRRLAASLIADQLLFEVESAMAAGNPPELGPREVDNPAEDEFLRVVEVSPLDPAMLGMAELLLPPGAEAGRPQPGTVETLPQLLLVNVRVSWEIGLTEQAVTRTSFAYDATAAIEALASADFGAEDETEDLTEDEKFEEEDVEDDR